MTLYTLPSITAIILKLLIALKLDYKEFLKSKAVTIFFISLLILNVCELVVFSYTQHADSAIWWLRIYYISSIIAISALVLLSADLADKKFPYLTTALIPIAISLSLLTLTPLVVLDAKSIGYSVRSVPGEMYKVMTLFVALGLIFALGLLATGAKKLSGIKAKRCSTMLVAVIPLASVVISAIILMALKFEINAACALSLAITAMLAMLIYTESKYNLFLINSYFPWTEEYKYKQKLNKLSKFLFLKNNYKSGIDIRVIQSEFEETLFNIALHYSEGNQTEAAKFLNIPRSTFSRKIKDHTEK